jgi:hypothetical protein
VRTALQCDGKLTQRGSDKRAVVSNNAFGIDDNGKTPRCASDAQGKRHGFFKYRRGDNFSAVICRRHAPVVKTKARRKIFL